MVDQNQTGAQVNGQPVMGGNPYDLIDNKNQNLNENPNLQNAQTSPSVQNIQVEQNIPVASPVPASVPGNIQQNIVEPVQSTQQQPTVAVAPQVVPQVKSAVEPGGFTKKLISFIAKLSGQPDPETGKGNLVAQTKVSTPVSGGQVPIESTGQVQTSNNVSATTKAANPFDSIMGGVTGFLDKVESKVESVAGIDLDAPINKPATSVAAPVVQQTVQPVSVQSGVSSGAVGIGAVVESSATTVEGLKEPTPQQPVEEKKEEIRSEAKIDGISKQEVKIEETETPVVNTVKTETDIVKKDGKVPVNPIPKNIQFDESKPV